MGDRFDSAYVHRLAVGNEIIAFDKFSVVVNYVLNMRICTLAASPAQSMTLRQSVGLASLGEGHDFVDGTGRFRLHRWADMAVEVERSADVRMAERLLHNLGCDVLRQQQRCEGVPEVVKSTGRELEFVSDLAIAVVHL